ncbi:hypothetical protein B0A52_06223 [Exophiala mesophila]|uniref:Uncharacterized protein n=1 Tax=Exophiala mesophila TaxID=212818 RepID=A0A438N2T9_EXOME|nr:hypothetical protein B0A52_06223 [Exophiala mesophila]
MSKLRPLNTSSTYSLAHTAQCKLHLSAKRGDRDLRFVLGHAFTLDNLMLRIVEIENRSAKSDFIEGKAPSEDGNPHYDCTAPKPPAPETKPTPVEPEPKPSGRRISFHDNNARPSQLTSTSGSNSPARQRSPPPPAAPRHEYIESDDSDDTSSDDYDEPNSYIPAIDVNSSTTAASHGRSKHLLHDAYSDSEDAALELADDELDQDPDLDQDSGLSLQRFASASAQPPRMIRSNSAGSSSSEDDDEPVSPPQLPVDVDVRELIGGEKDEELAGLYDSVKNCVCHGKHNDAEIAGQTTGFWDIPEDKSGGKRLAVVAIAAAV